MIKTPAIVAALLLATAPAYAATISVSDFSKTAYENAVKGDAVTEGFESYSEGNVANGFSTSVGTFSTLGGKGSGGTVTNAGFANDGTLLAIRDGNVYGRTSTTSALSGDAGDDKFLDSNDTHGIVWNVSTGSAFNRIVLTLTDAAEFGGVMRIGDLVSAPVMLSNLGNSAKKQIMIEFASLRQQATIYFFHTNKAGNAIVNDGFSIDDIAVSEVPLPAAGFLLLGGLGGLAAFGRRKSTK